MKWLVRVYFAVSVLAGAILIGGLFLPSRGHVQRSITIDRPPATVFTLLSSWRTYHEWSPWARAEPEAAYVFDGPPFGFGARYAWSGEGTASGELVMTRAEPYALVEATVDLGARGRGLMRFTIEPKPGGSVVTWSYDTELGLDLIGRYVGRTFDGRLGPSFESGLVALKAYAERLPGADFADSGAQIVELEPLQVVVDARQVRGNTAEHEAAFAEALAEVRGYMSRNRLREAGPAIAVTTRWEPPLWVFKAAVPYAGEPREGGEDQISFDVLPAGRAVRAEHRGPPEGVAPLSTKLDAYLRAHRLERAGPSWEVRVTDRDRAPPEDQVTELYIPVK
jgi:effector-binding domain-containing protein